MLSEENMIIVMYNLYEFMHFMSVELQTHWLLAWEMMLRALRPTLLCSLWAAIAKGHDSAMPHNSLVVPRSQVSTFGVSSERFPGPHPSQWGQHFKASY